MTALDLCKAALERGVLHLRVTRKPTGQRYSYWWDGHRAFSFNTVRALLRSKFATRAGGTVRKRDGVTWRKRNGQ